MKSADSSHGAGRVREQAGVEVDVGAVGQECLHRRRATRRSGPCAGAPARRHQGRAGPRRCRTDAAPTHVAGLADQPGRDALVDADLRHGTAQRSLRPSARSRTPGTPRCRSAAIRGRAGRHAWRAWRLPPCGRRGSPARAAPSARWRSDRATRLEAISRCRRALSNGLARTRSGPPRDTSCSAESARDGRKSFRGECGLRPAARDMKS